MPLKQYDAIQLKPDFRDTLGNHDAINSHPNRTTGKDEVAEYIVDNVIAEGRWPVQMTQLAEETGYSRQHCSNVISHYFEPVDGGGGTASTGSTSGDSSMGSTPDQQLSSGSSSTTSGNGSKSVFVEIDGHMQEVTIDIPDGVDRASYIQGYLDRAKEE